MSESRAKRTSDRLGALPRREVLGTAYPVATTRRARLIGLAFLDREQAGPGLLIPDCRSVHGFGMRFPLHVWFLGARDEVLEVRRLERRRIVCCRAAEAVLEVVAKREAGVL